VREAAIAELSQQRHVVAAPPWIARVPLAKSAPASSAPTNAGISLDRLSVGVERHDDVSATRGEAACERVALARAVLMDHTDIRSQRACDEFGVVGGGARHGG